jgi:hypothetical protein
MRSRNEWRFRERRRKEGFGLNPMMVVRRSQALLLRLLENA